MVASTAVVMVEVHTMAERRNDAGFIMDVGYCIVGRYNIMVYDDDGKDVCVSPEEDYYLWIIIIL